MSCDEISTLITNHFSVNKFFYLQSFYLGHNSTETSIEEDGLDLPCSLRYLEKFPCDIGLVIRTIHPESKSRKQRNQILRIKNPGSQGFRWSKGTIFMFTKDQFGERIFFSNQNDFCLWEIRFTEQGQIGKRLYVKVFNKNQLRKMEERYKDTMITRNPIYDDWD